MTKPSSDPIRAAAAARAARRRIVATRDLSGAGLNAFLHARGHEPATPAQQPPQAAETTPSSDDTNGADGEADTGAQPATDGSPPPRRRAPFLAQGPRGAGMPAITDPAEAFRQWANGELDRPHRGGIVNR